MAAVMGTAGHTDHGKTPLNISIALLEYKDDERIAVRVGDRSHFRRRQ